MLKLIGHLFIYLVLSSAYLLCSIQNNDETILSNRIANYQIEVKIDPIKKSLSGKEILTWKNSTDCPVSELQFHLYWNAFKNSNSTFLSESRASTKGGILSDESFGYIDVNEIIIDNEKFNFEFISPDDNNNSDQTVIKVKLNRIIKPQETIKIFLKFNSKIPKVVARAGYVDDFFMIAQWFPKIGVLEVKNNEPVWNCHQYHANSEFFSDFGNYNVKIEIPKNYVIGCSGIISGETNYENSKIINCYAKDVHDFAFCICPKLKEFVSKWKDVNIKLLFPPENEYLVDRHITAVKYALSYLDSVVGKYPYPNITIINPPENAGGAGGMEYPTLITTANLWGIDQLTNFPEMVTIHEFIHQYFYGMLANNEFEEAWLDEGFTQYMESRVMDHYFGENTSILSCWGIKIGDFEMNRSIYVNSNNKLDPSYKKSYLYKSGGYGKYTYMKPNVFLNTMQNIIGDSLMNIVLKTYFEKYKFTHPKSENFINMANDIISKSDKNYFDTKLYFDQVLYGTDVCDYGIIKVTNENIITKNGYYGNDSAKTFIKHDSHGNKEFKSSFMVHRFGEITLPIEIKAQFENGKSILEKWDGKDRYKIFEYLTDSPISNVEIDPGFKISLDINRFNNYYSIDYFSEALYKYFFGFLSLIQNLLQSIIIFI